MRTCAAGWLDNRTLAAIVAALYAFSDETDQADGVTCAVVRGRYRRYP